MSTLLGRGVYTISEMAVLTRIPYQRVRSWVTSGNRSVGLIVPEARDDGEFPSFSFLDLIEILVAGQLRERKITMQSVRRVHAAMKEMFGTEHPFAHERLLTQRKRVFQQAIDRAGKNRVVDVLSRQQVLPEVIEPYLKQLEYDPTSHVATLWRIASGVVVDPRRSFGKPIVEKGSVPVEALAAAYRANDENVQLVADWFNVTEAAVVDAVQFSHNLAA